MSVEDLVYTPLRTCQVYAALDRKTQIPKKPITKKIYKKGAMLRGFPINEHTIKLNAPIEGYIFMRDVQEEETSPRRSASSGSNSSGFGSKYLVWTSRILSSPSIFFWFLFKLN